MLPRIPSATAMAEEHDDPAGYDDKFEEAMALNAKLKAMLAGGGAGGAGGGAPDAAMFDEMQYMMMMEGGGGGGGGGYVGGGGYGGGGGYDMHAAPAAERGAGRRPPRQRSRGARGGGAMAGGASVAGAGGAGAGGAAAAAAAMNRNFTFNSDRLDDIGKGNERLMHALTRINRGGGQVVTRVDPVLRKKREASSSINRRRKNNKIMDENAAFLKRLQKIKPTKSMSRKTMKATSNQQRRFAKNCRQIVGPGGAVVKKPARRKKKKKAPARRPPPADFVF